MVIMQKDQHSNADTGRPAVGRIATVFIFMLLSVAGILFSVYLLSVANSAYTYVLAISFLALSLVAGFFNFFASWWYYKSQFYDSYLDSIKKRLKPLGKDMPSVSIVMPSHSESNEIITKNITQLKKMKYGNNRLHIYLLNDSGDEKKREYLDAMCRRNGINFIWRKENRAFKAGAINDFLKVCKDDFVAIFDADETLIDARFLLDVMPYFHDRKVAYVQTEKRYKKGTFFSESVDIFDAFFFKFIEPARATNNTAIFSGSCGVIRKSALDAIGGLPEYIIEDTFFSFESDMHGYKGIYLPKNYALGDPIRTFSKLAKQQWRYNYGDTQFLSYFVKKKGYRKKDVFPALNYVAHGFGLNYLSVILIAFTIISVGIVFSSVPFAHITLYQFIHANVLQLDLELLGLFAFLLSLAAPIFLTKIYFNSFRKGIMVFLLNYALAIIRFKAAITALVKKDDFTWGKVGSVDRKNLLSVLSQTKAETAFFGIMFLLSYMAFMQQNLAGGIWLAWYGAMYCLTTVFFIKYG